MTDPRDQERNDFRGTVGRRDPDAIEPGREYDDALDEARNRGDFTDPRVVQPGEDASPEAAREPVDEAGQRPR